MDIDALLDAVLGATSGNPGECWVQMLVNNWDYYAQRVETQGEVAAHYAHISEEQIREFGQWKYYEQAQAEDAKTRAIWQSLVGVKEHWARRWQDAAFNQAVDGFVDALFSTAGDRWTHILCLQPEGTRDRYWCWPWGDERWPDVTDYELLTEWWITYASDASCALHTLRDCQQSLSWHPDDYEHFQRQKQERRRLAVFQALRGLRRQLLAGQSELDDSELKAALALDGGSFDEDGNIIWFPNATPEQRADYVTWLDQHGLPPPAPKP